MKNLVNVFSFLWLGNLVVGSVRCEAANLRVLVNQIAPTMQLRLGFPNDTSSSVYVRRLLNGHELDTFGRLLKSYLRARDVAPKSLQLDNQRWLRYQHLNSDEDVQETIQETVLIRDSIRSIIDDIDSDTRIYTISFNLTFHDASQQNLAQVASVMSNDGENFLKVLKVGLDNVFASQGAENQVVVNHANDVPSAGLAWMLALLALSLACLLAVLVYRCCSQSDSNLAPLQILWKSRQMRHQRMDDDPVGKFEGKNATMGGRSEIDEILSAVDPDDHSFSSMLENHVRIITNPHSLDSGPPAAQMEESWQEEVIVAAGSSGSDSLYTSGDTYAKDEIQSRDEVKYDREKDTQRNIVEDLDMQRFASKRQLQGLERDDAEASTCKETATFPMQTELKTQGSLVFL